MTHPRTLDGPHKAVTWHLKLTTVERLDRIADALGMTRLQLAEMLLQQACDYCEKDAEMEAAMHDSPQTIWKLPLDIEKADSQFFTLPGFPDPLSLQLQRGRPCLWVMVPMIPDRVNYEVRIFGTGHEIPLDWVDAQYCGTFQLYEDRLVLHVFIRYSGNVEKDAASGQKEAE